MPGRTLFLFCAIVLAACFPAVAQKPGAAASGLSAEQAQAALDVLNDPAKRAAFAATLDAIVKTQRPPSNATQPAAAPSSGDGAKPAVNPPPAKPPQAGPPTTTTVQGVTVPLAPNSVGAEVLLSASGFLNSVGNQARTAFQAVQSLPLLYGWAVVMATNPIARNLLTDAAWRVAVIVACAFAAQWTLRYLMQRPIRTLEARGGGGRATATDSPKPPGEPDETPAEPADDDPVARAEAGESEAPAHRRQRPSPWTLLRRMPLVLARLLLELVPVCAIVLVGHLLAASSLGGQTASRLVVLAVIDAYAACAALLCVARMLLSPGTSRLRLFHLHDGTADYLMRWTRRLILIVVTGYAIGEVGLLLGLTNVAHEAIQKTTGLTLHVCMIVIVLQKRRAVIHWLRAPETADGPVARLRNRFARVWHWIALFFLIASWLVYAVEIPHGFSVVLHYFIVTALLLIGARLILLVLLGVIDRSMRPAPTLALSPGLRTRLSTYHPVVSTAVRCTVYLLAALSLLQLYGLNTFVWLFTSDLGPRLVSAAATLIVTVVLAVAIWEIVNGGVQRHLDRLQREAQLARSARLRTLLPLFRTALLITIAVVSILMILSDIGINVAPLLAGAGIIGVAIGFGSQKLVQDLITGIFLLLENAMQVGDTVTVSGLSGVVENLSVRTIRLRAGDGSVHIIPFSSVTSVTNVNRGQGNASVSVTVAYDENTDRASDELKAIIAEMRTNPDFAAKMLGDFQLWGVDKVDGASATIAGQVVCTDSGRWPVQREINRRIKQRFQAAGIRIFNPVQTIAVTAQISPEPDGANPVGKPSSQQAA